MNGHVRAIVTSVVWLACAFVVVFTATASRGASSNVTFRATNGLIAYRPRSASTTTAWHSQIFTVQPDGSHVHQLTHFGDGSGAHIAGVVARRPKNHLHALLGRCASPRPSHFSS